MNLIIINNPEQAQFSTTFFNPNLYCFLQFFNDALKQLQNYC